MWAQKSVHTHTIENGGTVACRSFRLEGHFRWLFTCLKAKHLVSVFPLELTDQPLGFFTQHTRTLGLPTTFLKDVQLLPGGGLSNTGRGGC